MSAANDAMNGTPAEAAREGTAMNLHKLKECLDVHISDIAGSVYDDVNCRARRSAT
jgi:hypothetical protein